MQKLWGVIGTLATLVLVGVFAYPVIDRTVKDVTPVLESVPEMLADTPLGFTMPDGFTAHIFAFNVKGPRVLTRDPAGVLVVSLTSEGAVVALPDRNNDKLADGKTYIVDGLTKPHGILFICPQREDCKLYIAEEHQVSEYIYNPETFEASFSRVLANLPEGEGHFTRTLLLHPDGTRILVSIGSSCNVCVESNKERASILSIDIRTGEKKTFATGLRNTVFFKTNPYDGSLWGTEMGRDHLGDDIPPDEVNIIEEGKNYGWPICFGANIHDTDFDTNTYVRAPCQEPFETPSTLDIPAHSAPLGIAFIPEEGWSENYRGDILVAFHGSWNRSELTGYKIVRYDYNYQKQYLGDAVDFMTGFQNGDSVSGRPVDILTEPGGTIFVSDDRADAIYRIVYTEPQS